MFIKTVIKQGEKIKELKKENKKIKEENDLNRDEIQRLGLNKIHARLLAQRTLDYLNDLQEIDRLGISEESKKKHRNIIINQLLNKNSDILKELDSRQTY